MICKLLNVINNTFTKLEIFNIQQTQLLHIICGIYIVTSNELVGTKHLNTPHHESVLDNCLFLLDNICLRTLPSSPY